MGCGVRGDKKGTALERRAQKPPDHGSLWWVSSLCPWLFLTVTCSLSGSLQRLPCLYSLRLGLGRCWAVSVSWLTWTWELLVRVFSGAAKVVQHGWFQPLVTGAHPWEWQVCISVLPTSAAGEAGAGQDPGQEASRHFRSFCSRSCCCLRWALWL